MAVNRIGILAAIGVLSPIVAFGQTRPQLPMQPASPWTLRVSAGPATNDADGMHAGPQLHLAVERTLTETWSVRVQQRTLHNSYDLGVNPEPVTSTTQFEFGLTLVRIAERSKGALTHAYVGGGASFLLTTFDGIVAPHNKALGFQGLAGFEIHPQSRRWSAFPEVFIQFRSRPPQLANGDLFMAQIGIGFGVSFPLRKRL